MSRAKTYEQVRKVLPVAFTDLGAQQVKNIEEPVRAYAIVRGQSAVARFARCFDSHCRFPTSRRLPCCRFRT